MDLHARPIGQRGVEGGEEFGVARFRTRPGSATVGAGEGVTRRRRVWELGGAKARDGADTREERSG